MAASGLVRVGANAYNLDDVQAVVKGDGPSTVTVVLRNGTPVVVKGPDAQALLDYVAGLPGPPVSGPRAASGRAYRAEAEADAGEPGGLGGGDGPVDQDQTGV